MPRRLLLALPIAVAALLGCSGEILTGEHAGSTTGAGGSGASPAGGAGGTSSGTGGAPGEALSGHYMQQQIGDCINAEEWLSFSPPSGFTHTLVDRSFCGPHSVDASPGQQTLQGDVIEYTWQSPTTSNLRRFTFTRVNPMPQPLAPPPVAGYQPGTAALNDMTYARTADPLVWHREDVWSETDQTGTYDRQFVADIAFTTPLGAPSSPTACSMTLTFSIQVTYAGALETGDETLSLPCTIAPDASLPWLRVTADGFEDPYDGKWWDYLTQLGIADKYSSGVESVLYDAFYPMFFYVPGDEAHLFHDRFQPWYFEYLNPPPDSIK